MVGTVAVLAAILVLSGCGRSDPLPTLPPTPSSTPVFASEEEALAAAEDAYAAYLEVSSSISAAGGADPGRIETVATRGLLDASLTGYATLRDNKWRTTGETRIAGAQLQFADLDAIEGEDVVGIYVCVDYADVDVLDDAGNSVVAPERPDLQAFEVFFDLVDRELIGSSVDAWDNDLCGTFS
jgi:hypothetical protein